MKKNIIKLSLLFSITGILQAAPFYDAVIEGTNWHESGKNHLLNRCLTMMVSDPQWQKLLPSEMTKRNVCDCITDGLIHNLDYNDYVTTSVVAYRKIGKEAGKYTKPIFQNSQDKIAYDNFKIVYKKVYDKCNTREVADKGILETYRKFQEQLQSKDIY